MQAGRLTALLLAASTVACGSVAPAGLAGDLAGICRRANADLDAIPAPTADPAGDPETFAVFFRASADANRAAAARVALLEAPQHLVEQRDGFAAAITDVASALDASAEAVTTEDEEALLAARDDLLEARERFDSLAASLGARACLQSRPPSPST